MEKNTNQSSIEKIVDEFEAMWHISADKRYGWVAHNNAIVQRQIDWLTNKLTNFIAEERERVIRELKLYRQNLRTNPEIILGFDHAINVIESFDTSTKKRK